LPVYHSFKTIFVRVPKTASTSACDKLYSLESFARYFSPQGDTPRPKLILPGEKHEGILEIKENMSNNMFDDYYKVAFVRNPWDWLVSYYFYYKKLSSTTTGGYTGTRKLFTLSDGAIKINKIASDALGEKAVEIKDKENISFKEFLMVVESESKNYEKGVKLNQLAYPYQPQYKYLVDKDDDIVVNFVGKYENLENDWKYLCERLKLVANRRTNLALSRLNQSEHRDYRLYYDESDAEMVYNVYKKDIGLFDYSF